MRLHSSVNRLLDLAKTDVHGIRLQVSKIDPADEMRKIYDFYRSSVPGSSILIELALPDVPLDGCDLQISCRSSVIRGSSSFGVSSLKDNASWLEERLSIKSIRSLYDFSRPETIDRDYREQMIDLIPEFPVEMADQALYQAKGSSCDQCGFKSVENSHFDNGICSKCGSADTVIGRNRTVLF